MLMPMTTDRLTNERLLLEVTQIPTAAGREDRVVSFVEAWVRGRAGMSLTRDGCGNMFIASEAIAHASRRASDGASRPIFFTAHLDHPAMVVERILSPGALELSLRGGVMQDYLKNAEIVVVGRNDIRHRARLGSEPSGEADGFKLHICELERSTDSIMPGDVAVWALPPAEIENGIIHTNACDDLAALASALCAFDALHALALAGEAVKDTRLLFTRAEEIGFVGAIGACREGSIPRDARLIALENSRAMDESMIGAGPIVRVGDRISVFSPSLTSACSKVAEDVFKRSAYARASEKQAELGGKPWQRMLMPGGACESTVFCAYGYEATCLCLPLGNYHNMGDLAAVQAGTNTNPPRLAREYVSVEDFHGLTDLLIACGTSLPDAPPITQRLEGLWEKYRSVVGGSA